MKIYFSLIFIFAICCAVTTRTAFACDCGGGSKINKQQMDNSTLIFSGKFTEFEWRKDIVVKIAEDDVRRNGGTYEVLTARFEVDKWWKGAPGKTVSVIQGRIRFSKGYSLLDICDFRFNPGESYLVYAHDKDNKYFTDECTGTKILAEATDDLKILSEGKNPIEENKITKPQ